MGTLTTTDLIAEVRSYLGERSDVTDARIVRALNLGQEFMARSKDYEELRKTASNALTVSDKFLEFTELPAGLQKPYEIYSFRVITGDGRSRKLTYRTARTFDRLIPEPEFHATGLPSTYTVWADKFELWKLPDEAYNYEIRMTILPTPLVVSLGTAVSDLDGKDDLLIFLAVSWVFGSLGEYDRMKSFFGMFAAREKLARDEDDRRPDVEIVSDHGKARPDVVVGHPWADPFVNFMR